jgi:hypothetical protein
MVQLQIMLYLEAVLFTSLLIQLHIASRSLRTAELTIDHVCGHGLPQCIGVGCGKLFRHSARNVVEGIRSIAPSFLTRGWLLTATALGQEKEP